jgi:4,5-dihydroxyphthalate decarboxylase
MARQHFRYLGKDYDFLAPLACGDVVPEGLDLQLERSADTMAGGAGQVRFVATPEIDAGEYSLSLYLIALARGDRSWVGIPFFPARGFRHHCLYVRADSGLTRGKDLDGKRVGLNAWKTTGNAWTRAALREDGADLASMSWVVGPIDGTGRDAAHNKPQVDLPPKVRAALPGQTLESLLLDGELDAIMCPAPPSRFGDGSGPIVRLYRDHRRVEQAYYARTGIYPAHHLVVIRREAFDRNPRVAGWLYTALEQSRQRWQARRRGLAETTPWMEDDIAEATRVFGGDWQVNGVGPTRAMIETFCREQHVQGLVDRAVDPAEVFAEFERASGG